MSEAGLDPWWTTQGPWVHNLSNDTALEQLKSGAGGGSYVAVLHGSAMRVTSTLMREFARAFHFPQYFGENWSALEDCLQDLGWMAEFASYLVIIVDGDLVLRSGGEGERELLYEVLNSVGEIWAHSGRGDKGVPFNSVFIDKRRAARLET